MTKKKAEVHTSPFTKQEFMTVKEGVISKNDVIRIDGEQGKRFVFLSLTTNPSNDATWVDCIELDKGAHGPFRSFVPEKVRYVRKQSPKRKSNVGSCI